MLQLPYLILFTRFPQAGACKTRLIPAVGPEGAAEIHRKLTAHTVDVLRDAGPPVIVATTGADEEAFASWLGTEVGFKPQVTGGLTERLLAFLNDAPVIFFGADTPDLADAHVRAALEGLGTHEIVIGPASDGGYYLIGMRDPHPELFIDMAWSTPDVLPETLRRLERLGIEPLLLETLSDCDRPEDLDQWPHLVA